MHFVEMMTMMFNGDAAGQNLYLDTVKLSSFVNQCQDIFNNIIHFTDVNDKNIQILTNKHPFFLN